MELGKEDAMNERAEAEEAKMPFEVEERSAASVSPFPSAKRPIDIHTCIRGGRAEKANGTRHSIQTK